MCGREVGRGGYPWNVGSQCRRGAEDLAKEIVDLLIKTTNMRAVLYGGIALAVPVIMPEGLRELPHLRRSCAKVSSGRRRVFGQAVPLMAPSSALVLGTKVEGLE